MVAAFCGMWCCHSVALFFLLCSFPCNDLVLLGHSIIIIIVLLQRIQELWKRAFVYEEQPPPPRIIFHSSFGSYIIKRCTHTFLASVCTSPSLVGFVRLLLLLPLLSLYNIQCNIALHWSLLKSSRPFRFHDFIVF